MGQELLPPRFFSSLAAFTSLGNILMQVENGCIEYSGIGLGKRQRRILECMGLEAGFELKCIEGIHA